MRFPTIPAVLVLVAWSAGLGSKSVQAASLLAAPPLDAAMVADVAATALAFMVPRTLEPVTPSQLTLWGLRGLTTLDTRLTPSLNAGLLTLSSASASGEQLLVQVPAPAEQDIPGWGRAAATLVGAGWNVSQAVRGSGTAGIIRTFFDEVFNHLDPYSRYESFGEAAPGRAERSSEATIGVTLAVLGNQLAVATVAASSSAAQAGIRPGDRLLAIDGDPVAADDLWLAQQALLGSPGATVALTVRHRGTGQATVSVRRRPVAPPTVSSRRVGDLLLLRVSGFASDTGDTLAQALRRGLAEPRLPHGVVLDLRGNRGGLLLQAVAAARVLLAQGVIAVTAGRHPEALHDFIAGGRDQARGLPVAVLVDGRSASAAEILAAALADQHRAVVVGSATLGKGLVQTITPLPDGGELLVTWSRVLAPLGWPLQGLGVLPQVCTSLGQAATLQQLAALAEGRQLLARTLARSRSARVPLPPAEALEIRAACPASEGRDEDLFAARFLAEHPAAYAAALIGPASAP